MTESKQIEVKFIQSMSTSTRSYRGGEYNGDKDFFDELQAVRFIDAGICVPINEDEYIEAKANVEKLLAEAEERKILAKDIENINTLKEEKQSLEDRLDEVNLKLLNAESAISKSGNTEPTLIEKFEEDKTIVKDLLASDLKTLCSHFEIDYIDVATAKQSLEDLEV